MSEKIDEAKGRAKEAAGALTDDEELKREGKIEQAESSVKEGVDRGAELADDLVDRAADKAKDAVDRDD